MSSVRWFLYLACLGVSVIINPAYGGPTEKGAPMLASPPVKIEKANENPLVISHFLTGLSEPTVMIKGGKKQGVLPGSLFYSLRPAPRNQSELTSDLIETGVLKAILVEDTYTIAKIITDGSLQSKAFFPKFPGIMAGDAIRWEAPQLAQVPSITPIIATPYSELFVDPKADPTSFELSPEGESKLREIAAQYVDVRLPVLLIEAFTDPNGPADANQVESYQRAVTIRQYLINEMGFDPTRIVAIGYGESEPLEGLNVPGYREQNRRIVFKAKALDNTLTAY